MRRFRRRVFGKGKCKDSKDTAAEHKNNCEKERKMKSTTKVILGTMTFGAQTNRADAVKMLKLFAEKYGANAEVRR